MKYLNCSRAWCCCLAAWNLLEHAQGAEIGLSRGMSPKLEVVGSWILFIIMKCLRVVKLVVIKRWSKGCYHHTISYEFWWRVLSRYPQLTWTNSLERELTYRDSLDLWASLSDLERAWASVILGYWAFFKHELPWAISVLIPVLIPARKQRSAPYDVNKVYFFVVQCRISSATKTSVNGPSRLTSEAVIKRSISYKLSVTSYKNRNTEYKLL